ncbi:MAG: UDP-N-acetylmuramoyl-L-alanyl-D-glutamate--2,6-diaminopimelate ligase [candidate division KSB1 bacterium]|nr:UDP-N-acetylmuramoyl-L-alanyl-D-glutamate--2,6-diaminopimelate ligase [candidate division KSB1 bacterium]MDZ7318403.1 UDP-N-acetylmuramoyl-L-alanyl-D-glutamate--2,6-diaminopimelate ligase [candidate division KSB1 bacterium]MDZ7342051.1 UDP-N-acetylmuramoyl-L-alanyl-D-glutamate--2,6-diaminopimelate ligase [candidate division KSB1 bacterium]
MKLSALLAVLNEKQVYGSPDDMDVNGIVYDPLRVRPGFMFVAIEMYTQLDKIEIPDGHDRVHEAIQAGASVVVLQRDLEVPAQIVKVIVPNTRYALALMANQFYGFPSHRMRMIGVTGTNGKTTTTHIIESILAEHYRVGLIGTLYYKINGQIHKSKDTTPEPPDLQEIFQQMVRQNVDYCVMEVSSHGIDFYRVHDVHYQVALFTNLTQDHLDYHKTMENYLQTKLKLFSWLKPEDYAIVNMDDGHAPRFLKAATARHLTYGIQRSADIMAKDVDLSLKGTKYRLITPMGEIDIHQSLIGLFNVSNSLAAVAVAVSQGIDLETIKTGLEKKIRVAGRMELVDKGQPFSVVVDYAHTPDGMEKVLQLARSLKPHRIITAFGCGGDRDKEKRPIMGAMAARYSDVIVLTADNPRNEDPEQIISDIAAGMNGFRYEKIIDRRAAIEHAIQQAQPGDVVMLLGKGHENTQTLKDRTVRFNDVEEAERALDRLR